MEINNYKLSLLGNMYIRSYKKFVKTSDEINTNPNPRDLQWPWVLISKKLMYAHVVGSFVVSNNAFPLPFKIRTKFTSVTSLEHLSLADFSGE